jgi:hypothetical protein
VPRAVHAAGGRIWAPDQSYLTPAMLAEARTLGIAVIPWTVNDPAMMAKLLDMRVDGIISDRPDLVQRAAEAALTGAGGARYRAGAPRRESRRRRADSVQSGAPIDRRRTSAPSPASTQDPVNHDRYAPTPGTDRQPLRRRGPPAARPASSTPLERDADIRLSVSYTHDGPVGR